MKALRAQVGAGKVDGGVEAYRAALIGARRLARSLYHLAEGCEALAGQHCGVHWGTDQAAPEIMVAQPNPADAQN